MCECLKKFNEKLIEHNGRIAMALTLSEDFSSMGARIIIATEKIDKSKRKPVPVVMASHCPFCGVAWVSA